MIVVREITADDWELMRDVRLAALSEAPYAFGSTYAREAAFTEEQLARPDQRPLGHLLRATLTRPRRPVDPARHRGRPAGLAGVYVEDGQAELVSMWVRPSARGASASGEALVEAAAAWARAHYSALFLWVTEANAPARRLYERCGFTADRRTPAAALRPDAAGNPDAPAAVARPAGRLRAQSGLSANSARTPSRRTGRPGVNLARAAWAARSNVAAHRSPSSAGPPAGRGAQGQLGRRRAAERPAAAARPAAAGRRG